MRYFCIFYVAENYEKISRNTKKVKIIEIEDTLFKTTHSIATIINFIEEKHDGTHVRYIRCMNSDRVIYRDSELEKIEVRNDISNKII